MSETNPWVPATSDDEGLQALQTPAVPDIGGHMAVGPQAPQPGVPVPDTADRLPRVQQGGIGTVWWVGAHGGSGESTLAALGGGTRGTGHAWPMPIMPSVSHRVALVARTNYAGLVAAQRAATEWASGDLGEAIELVGLVLIADAPGRLPRRLRELEEIVSGGVPRTWTIGWHEPWRLGYPAKFETAPPDVKRLLSELRLPITRPVAPISSRGTSLVRTD